MKNTFASINRIPPEALSLITHHRNTDKGLLTLTHVCRSWREIFISHASLWADLDCGTINKTRLFLKRSKTSPLRIHPTRWFSKEALLLTVPHLNRLESLSLSKSSTNLLQLIEHLCSPSPFLKTLSLTVTHGEPLALRDSIFGGNLSSLHDLRLDGLVTNLAWENMSNLRIFHFCHVPADTISVTQLLDFFERAPLLHEILLEQAFPDFSDALPGRIVPLPNLKHLTITARPLHTTLMNHLLIPTGASINQTVYLSDARSPILSHLPNDFKNLKHLSSITSITLNFASQMRIRFEGPSGGHCLSNAWFGRSPFPTNLDCRVLQSLDVLPISAVERLAIEHWQSAISSTAAEESPIYRALHLMVNLRALTLTACPNHPFLCALNPKRNASRTIICPRLEKFVVHIGKKERYFTNGLLKAVKERVSRGARLEAVTIIDGDGLLSAAQVLELRTSVSRIEYRQANAMPNPNAMPNSNAMPNPNAMPNSNAIPRVIDLTGDESD